MEKCQRKELRPAFASRDGCGDYLKGTSLLRGGPFRYSLLHERPRLNYECFLKFS